MKPIRLLSLQHLIVMASLLVLVVSFYLQYAEGLEPCPLCLMQRLCIVFILASSFMGLYRQQGSAQNRLFCVTMLFALAGLYFALRQVWLMSLPADDVPACLPGIHILLHYFPWQDLAKALILGSGDCTEISWTWLGLSLPNWSVLYFVFIILTASIRYLNDHRSFSNIK